MATRPSNIFIVLLPALLLLYSGCSGVGETVKSREAEKHYATGVELHETGNLLEAIVEYGEAIRLDPELAKAYANRALAYTELGKDAEAARDAEKAIELGYDPTLLTGTKTGRQ